MHPVCTSSHRLPGFALVELFMSVAAVVVIVSVLLIASASVRQASMLGQDMHKLRALGAATHAFASDNDDNLWTFDWKGGVQYNTPWPDLNFASTDQQAAANQAIAILRARTGRHIPRVGNWLPNVMYSHLILADYFDEQLPWTIAISAGDRNRLLWASDPLCFEANCFHPCNPFPWGDRSPRWPYSGSFQLVPAAWDRSPVQLRVDQQNAYFYNAHLSTLGPGLLSDVAFPSRKVLMHDERDRHSGNPVLLHFANPDARLPLLFADGRARVKHTADANPGWRPNQPANPHPTVMLASDEPYCEPGQPLAQTSTYQVNGVFRWTRGGLAGRDFAGTEINTGQHGRQDMDGVQPAMAWPGPTSTPIILP